MKITDYKKICRTHTHTQKKEEKKDESKIDGCRNSVRNFFFSILLYLITCFKENSF